MNWSYVDYDMEARRIARLGGLASGKSPSSSYEGREHVANVWQDDQPRPVAANVCQRVGAGQPVGAIDDPQQPLSVPRFPWYY